jgi:hypothetical protein
MGWLAHRFGRVEPRRRAGMLMLGLVAGLPRANCWTIAEHAGEGSPDGMQHLLARAVWDHDAVRDDLREYVVEHLGDPDRLENRGILPIRQGTRRPDEHQLRRWTSWQRWTILAILAHAFLSVMTATQSPPDPDSKLIPLTRNEIRSSICSLAPSAPPSRFQLVTMAAPTPSPSPSQPLPPTSPRADMITIYGWSTR